MSEVPWTKAAWALSSQPTPKLLAELQQLIAGLAEIDVWVWDQQHQQLISITTGASVDSVAELREAPAWSHATPIRHLGHSLGVLTLALDDVSNDDVAALAYLVGASMRANGPASEVLELSGRRREMALPAEMQWALLPPVQLSVGGVRLGAAVEPAYDTGGDVFDYSLLGDHLFCAVLDAKGHGLKAALTSTLATSALRQARRDGRDLEGIAQAVTEAILAAGQHEDFVSAVMVEMDIGTGQGSWLSAGHLPPLVVCDGEVSELELAPALPLGMAISGETSAPIVQALALGPGETLALYSDGIVENAMIEGAEVLGDRRFHEILSTSAARAPARSADNLAREVVERLLELTGTTLRDDATLLTVSRADEAKND